MMTATKFTCDVRKPAEVFQHFWEHTVGSGHATLALRADWQQQLTRCSKELGFRHVRFHGILSDDMGTLVNELDQDVFSFFNADQICDFLLSIGMKPFMELSFMPLTLSSGSDSVFHYRGNITPPRDYDEWQKFINTLVQHWAARYGVEEVRQWFFEIWNEPNLKAFWTGNQAGYFQLYESAVRGIKQVDREFKVGGPATAGNAWITDFSKYCIERQVPFDFISTHHYPTDSFGRPGDDTVAQLAASQRSVLKKQVAEVKSKASGRPVYYTEWSTSSNPFDTLHDQSYASAFISKTIMEAFGYVEGYSYWTFTDIFEENFFSSKPFHGGFGLMNINGIPKPAYRAFELLHHLGDEMLSVNGSHKTVDVWVTRKQREIKILVVNSALPEHPLVLENVHLELTGIDKVASCYVERIDDEHANANEGWIALGSPASLSREQVASLEEVSRLVKEPVSPSIKENILSLYLDVPQQGVACITLDIA